MASSRGFQNIQSLNELTYENSECLIPAPRRNGSKSRADVSLALVGSKNIATSSIGHGCATVPAGGGRVAGPARVRGEDVGDGYEPS